MLVIQRRWILLDVRSKSNRSVSVVGELAFMAPDEAVFCACTRRVVPAPIALPLPEDNAYLVLKVWSSAVATSAH